MANVAEELEAYSQEDSTNLKYSGTSFETSNAASTPVLPWDRFSQWVFGIGVVVFDLEIGQQLEMIYPGHIKLTEKEKANICYLSFPDSNSGCMGDTQFHFRIRQCQAWRRRVSTSGQYNQDCPVSLQCDSNHLFGFVYFRQVKDKSQPRGYFQKSVVLLTKLPLVNLFYKVVELIAPEFFDNGEPSIEAACHDLDQWPLPLPGENINLPLMGTVLQLRIPTKLDKYTQAVAVSPQEELADMTLLNRLVLPTLHEPDLFSSLSSVLYHVHLLWELILVGEPVVVMASSPAICSQTVQALVSIIWPLKFCCDYRPYFTIHDSEFKEFTTKIQSPPPVVLGVTNPFFAKTLQHWPHIIRLSDIKSNQSITAAQKQKIKKGGNLKTLDYKPGVYTRYHPFLQKDKTIIKKLLKGIQNKRPKEVQNALLRRHLLELTQSFMIPLERYMASLMPLQRNISPHKAAPTIRPFNPDEFFKMLQTSGPELTSGIKGDWAGLYKRFFRSLNFLGWYDSRHREVTQKLQILHLEALCDADLRHWIKDKQEVEVVDLILKIRNKLASANSEKLPLSAVTAKRLHGHMEEIISSLPSDLQSVLKCS